MLTSKHEAKNKAVLASAFKEHSNGLSSYSFYKLHDKPLCEDLVQETFMKTWKYLAKGGKVDLMRAFLYHVLNGLIIDEYRKNKPVSLDLLREKGFEPTVSYTEHLLDSLDGRAATALISKLPLKYQKVMRMKHVQGLNLTEISLITGQTKSTIAVQAHRGLEKLKILYDPE